MTEETLEEQNPDTGSADTPDDVDSSATVNEGDADTKVSAPEFPELQQKTSHQGGANADLNRLHDVKVAVSAELGRTTVPIQDLLNLGEGSVFELNRSVDSPVELIAQGVPLGNGEVVVVDDNFAIRILEIYDKS